MAADKKVMLAVAGAGALGAAYYAASSTTRPATKPISELSDNKARDKKNMGLGGAGIGNTHAAGGTERAIDPSKDRKVETTRHAISCHPAA
ncbi:hypothetical protein NLG97_g4295 [Lecanicillium saksenae]|uniref:Uncharacterized protein n=1 Tax=Lecanicillium saksenae TaxID=468837 RepID=A0ACC1QVV7_9HYPO|nr:hypothetical protein NLG97_g4295 [Lecanicillium saksenae]